MGGFLPITVAIAFNGSLAITNPTQTVGQPSRGLLAGASSATIYCVGSPAPTELSVSGFFAANTSFHSTRFTEGWANAFQKRSAGTDSGTRVMALYAGIPPGASLYVPDYVAGSNSAQPTAAGDLGVTASGGRYTGGSGALLFALVRLTDSNGGGGVMAGQSPPPGSTVTFETMSEVPLTGGSGEVVYEVLEANPAQQESMQFPAFLIYTSPQGGGNTATARQDVSFAPLSVATTGNSSAPVPRFANVAPTSDCSVLRDCGASYFPKLFVDSPPLSFKGPAGSGPQVVDIRVNNEGGGILTGRCL